MLAVPEKRARLFRMATPEHLCPYGLKARWLLRRRGYAVEDHLLTSRTEQEAFKAEHDVATTPQTWIGDTRVGGYDDLRRFFGQRVPEKGDTSYVPVIAVFATAALLAFAASTAAFGTAWTVRAGEWFVSFGMALLAMLKLQDVKRFSTMFLSYDMLARRFVGYAYLYPFFELLAGVLMASGQLPLLSVPVALAIGGIGAASVFKAVYVDRREIKCACVGGSSNVPLGFVSLTENLMMVAMAVWMVAR